MSPEAALASFNQQIERIPAETLTGPTPKIVFICGTPRSGTTVLAQALAHAGDLGVVNNLIARFVANPVLGVRLWQALNLPKVYSGRSTFGATPGLSEPHEFGRFWLRTLNLDGLAEPAERPPLPPDAAARLVRIARAFEKPTLFKSFAYLWYIDELDAALDDVCWIHLRRDLEASATSLQKLYEARADETGPPRWTSLVTQKTIRKASELPLPDRCRAQIRDLDQRLHETLGHLPAERTLTLTLEDFQTRPQEVVQASLAALDVACDPARLAEIGNGRAH